MSGQNEEYIILDHEALMGKTNFKSLLRGDMEIGESSDPREDCARQGKKG